MNPSDAENPMLIRYVLDELSAAERATVESWLRENPALLDEVQDMQELTETLRAEAPMHDLRLTPPQRARVMQGPPRRLQPVSRSLRPTARPGLLPALFRAAAVITLLAGAYLLGRKHDAASSYNPPLAKAAPEPATPVAAEGSTLVASNSQQETEAAAPAVPVAETEAPLAEPLLTGGVQTPAVEVDPAKETPVAKPDAAAPVAVPAPKPEVMLVGGPAAVEEEAPAKRQATVSGMVSVKADAEFASTSRHATDAQVVLPRLIKPPAPSSSEQLSAKPLEPGQARAQTAPPRRKPDLRIHAWSYETTSCPWNPRHRLLRVHIQLPADQEAVALGNHEYPVEVHFDANHVREFRRLGTRYLPSAELRSAGSQTLWYEFLPNGAPATHFENGKLVATVRLPGAKFTTQAVGPFDASRLLVLDRGSEWRDAREDFLFETAVVGLGLLLDGASKAGGLNQKLILDLAETAREAGDPDGSRARFISTLRQLDRLAGR